MRGLPPPPPASGWDPNPQTPYVIPRRPWSPRTKAIVQVVVILAVLATLLGLGLFIAALASVGHSFQGLMS